MRVITSIIIKTSRYLWNIHKVLFRCKKNSSSGKGMRKKVWWGKRGEQKDWCGRGGETKKEKKPTPKEIPTCLATYCCKVNTLTTQPTVTSTHMDAILALYCECRLVTIGL